MRKRGTNVVIFLSFLILLIIPLVSAGVFSDLWGKITGYGTSGTTTVNITIGNAAPTIGFVEVIPDLTPNESWTNTTTFNFTATDTDGFTNINVSSAQGFFQRGAETTRSDLSCINWSQSVNDVNFTCTIGMWYFDEAGEWTINVTIRDNNQATAENSSTSFTYISLKAMVMSPIALGWPEINLPDTDTGANENITINNTGNAVNLNISITAYNLQGNETLTNIFLQKTSLLKMSQRDVVEQQWLMQHQPM
ncbi:hypothetical protein LCGC14_2442400 [marine sediment metagenome]|uniref:Uncharacterized protein n=1 Tax=marine sediment metagenome TaxID=412755 RepID=A0A0F9C626_9ZZZZ